MRIAFNPSTVAALIAPPNNKDITFDLRGQNIFARGVKFCGTDTNTWRDIKINNVSIDSNILDLRDGDNTTLTNINGVVTINSTWRPVVDNLTSDSTTSSLSANLGRVLKALIDGKSDSDHNHDDRYLRLTGGLMLGDITFGGDNKIIWGRNTDSASISFKNDGDGDADSYMSFVTSDNGNEYFRWSHSSGSTNTEWMSLRSDGLRVRGTKVSLEGHSHDDRYVKKSGDTMLGALNFANGTWNLVGDDSYMGDCNISGHFGIKAANTTYPGIAFFNNANDHLGSLTAYNGNIKYGAYSLQFLDNGNTSVSASTWMNPFSTYNASAVTDGQAICVWGQSSSLSNLAADSGDMSLWLKRVNANVATLNMVLDGEYYANGNLRLAHVSEIPNSLKNPYALTISLNGTSQGPYDGSAAKSINITPSSIGAATSDHNHDGRYVYNYGGTQMDGASINKNALGMATNSGITEDWWHILQAAWNSEYRWNSLIAFPTLNRNGMYYRSGLDDNTAWGAWVKLLDVNNYSSTLDSRYYTESEIDSLLDAKLDRQNLSYGTWNPRGYNLAADYSYNGGDLSISESGGLIHVSVDGYFWLNEGLYRVLDTSDIGSIQGSITILLYLSNTDTNWYPLIWGGNDHRNTYTSTGGIYKSHDVLSWLTSSLTLYATHLRTTDLDTLTAFFRPGNDSTLKIYSGITLDAVSDGHIGLLTSIDGTDGLTHVYPTLYGSRCVLALLPRGGSVYIGNMPNGGNSRKLNVNGDIGLFNVGSIRDLTIGGGIYWNPYVESTTDGSDAASITLVKSGVAGGTTLVLSLMNDANDTILFQTNGSARLYHNSYPILTTLNTYVSDNKGYINGTEITLVNNANYSGSTGKLSSLGGYTYDNLSTDIPTNAVSYKIITSGGTDLGDSQYNVLHIPWSSGDWGIYLLFGANNGRFGVKYKHSGAVREVLDSSNYTSYAIPTSASCNKNWSYSGQSGQPTWLWGTNDGTNCYVWNPSNFSVNYANSANTSNRTKFLETFRQDSTTDTYGTSYPIWAQWANSTNVRLKCTNYTVWTDKADYATSAGNADTVDGYHIADESRQVYRNSYTIDSPAGAWILIKLPAWNANNEIVAIDGYGDNRQAHCVVHCGSRYQGIWGYQSDYNGTVVDRIGWKEVDSGKFALVALINEGITTLRIRATNSLEISKTTEGGATFVINSNFFSSGGVFHGNVDWDKIIGKPSSFTPSEHTHSWTSITDKIVAGNEFNIVNAGFNSDMYFNYLPINDRNSTAYINSYIFGNGHQGLALVLASGFIKNGSSSNYVLLGDGGHKAISDFAPSSHSHNYAANENYGGFTKLERLPISGFYQSTESESGGNAPWSNWMHLINCQHSNTGNNYALLIAASFFDNNTFKIRVTNNDVNNDWRDIIHSGNIGSQTVANAYHLYINYAHTWSTWYWSGLSGQPSWLWGSNDGTNMYVWDPNNFNVHTAQYLRSLGNLNCQTGRTLNYGDVYSYNTYDGNTDSPTSYTSVIGFGRGIAGTVEIAGGWCNTHLYWRSLRDCCDDWYSWRTVLDSSNYTEFINNYYWANVKISASSSTTTSPTVHTLTATRVCAGHNPEIDNSISCSNWFRSSGDTGWYNTTYRGGWYMSDTSWIRAHNGVGIYTSGQIYSPSSVKAGDILLGYGNEINSDTGLYLNYRSSNNVGLCQGGGNVGIGTTSPSYKLDVNGLMRASGFHHSSVNSDNYILLAGGGYKPYGGNYDNPIFLGYLNLERGYDGTISSSFYCLGYSVSFTYTRGGNYCKIYIPDTSYQAFYIRAATASVNYSGGGMDTWTGYRRGDGAWWLHCYAYSSNEVRVKGFRQANDSNDSWWGGNPLVPDNGGANRITVCIFGYVTFR